VHIKAAGFILSVAAGLLTAPLASAAAFPGTGGGNIPDPDASHPGPADYATPLVVSFNVTNLQTNVQSMSLAITMNHQWVGDLDVYLTSPAGTNFTIFSRVGPSISGGYGNPLDLGGTYVFSDASAPSNTLSHYCYLKGLNYGSGIDFTNIIPEGNYRTSVPGTGATTGFETASSFATNSGFIGLAPAQANGTWHLTFRDGSNTGTGAVQSATLYLNTPLNFTAITVTNAIVQLKLTGQRGDTFTIWAATNLALPFTAWNSLGGGTFDSSGNATFTTNDVARVRFYRASNP